MTRPRARAYARVMKTLREVGPAKLLPAEQERIRRAADARVFSSSLATDESARAAFIDVDALCEHLIESGRWSVERAVDLATDLWVCGPALDEASAAAA
jgi:hypothetical protein